MRATGLIAAVSAALLLAACGGPSKEEYIARVDDVCREARPEAVRIAGAFTRARRASRRASLRLETSAADQAVQFQTRVLAELKDIDRPGGEAGEGAERFIRSNERDLANLRGYAAALRQRSRQAITRAQQQIRSREGDTIAIARNYGFKACAGRY